MVFSLIKVRGFPGRRPAAPAGAALPEGVVTVTPRPPRSSTPKFGLPALLGRAGAPPPPSTARKRHPALSQAVTAVVRPPAGLSSPSQAGTQATAGRLGFWPTAAILGTSVVAYQLSKELH
ncbi:hypothetical protein HK405_015313 [Cladochytrium tenue]|nr:hypothetical protein HK405_015313 [Cladochytrium tenue]